MKSRRSAAKSWRSALKREWYSWSYTVYEVCCDLGICCCVLGSAAVSWGSAVKSWGSAAKSWGSAVKSWDLLRCLGDLL